MMPSSRVVAKNKRRARKAVRTSVHRPRVRQERSRSGAGRKNMVKRSEGVTPALRSCQSRVLLLQQRTAPMWARHTEPGYTRCARERVPTYMSLKQTEDAAGDGVRVWQPLSSPAKSGKKVRRPQADTIAICQASLIKGRPAVAVPPKIRAGARKRRETRETQLGRATIAHVCGRSVRGPDRAGKGW